MAYNDELRSALRRSVIRLLRATPPYLPRDQQPVFQEFAATLGLRSRSRHR